MKNIALFSLLLTCMLVKGQVTDLLRIADLHDLLFYNRTARHFDAKTEGVDAMAGYNDSHYRIKFAEDFDRAGDLLRYSDSLLRLVRDTNQVIEKYTYCWSRFRIEYEYLFFLNRLKELGPSIAAEPFENRISALNKVTLSAGEKDELMKLGVSKILTLTADKSDITWDTKYSGSTLALDTLSAHLFLKRPVFPRGASDLTKLLDVHDMLYLARMSKCYLDRTQTKRITEDVRDMLAGIRDSNRIRLTCPSLYNAYRIERSWFSAAASFHNNGTGQETFLRFDSILELLRIQKVKENLDKESDLPDSILDSLELINRENIKSLSLLGPGSLTVESWRDIDISPVLIRYNQFVLDKMADGIGQIVKGNLKMIGKVDLLSRQYRSYQKHLPGGMESVLESDSGYVWMLRSLISFHKLASALQEMVFLNHRMCGAYLAAGIRTRVYDYWEKHFWDQTERKDRYGMIKNPVFMDAPVSEFITSLKRNKRIVCGRPDIDSSAVKEEILIETSLWLKREQKDPLLDGGGYNVSTEPEYNFPIPPPQASSDATDLIFRNIPKTLGDANTAIRTALKKGHYDRIDYYAIAGGFVLVTPLEQLMSDATPVKDPPRWDTRTLQQPGFSLIDYFKALFQGKKGYFRMLVFIVTDKPLSLDGPPDLAVNKLRAGLNKLDLEVAAQPFTAAHSCSVFVYEFEKTTNEPSPRLIVPGRNSIRTHLDKIIQWGDLFR